VSTPRIGCSRSTTPFPRFAASEFHQHHNRPEGACTQESPAVPEGHPVDVAALGLLHRAAAFQLTLARGTILGHVQIEVRALLRNAERFLAALEQAEEAEPGFIRTYALRLAADGADLPALFDPQTEIPDSPEGLAT
jgi:hypothetical protein